LRTYRKNVSSRLVPKTPAIITVNPSSLKKKNPGSETSKIPLPLTNHLILPFQFELNFYFHLKKMGLNVKKIGGKRNKPETDVARGGNNKNSVQEVYVNVGSM
jgi:hypothetical protein